MKTDIDRDILISPVATEKAIRLMESENKLVFDIDMKADKQAVSKSFEELFKVKPLKVNTLVDPKGRKRAYVRLPPDKQAIDIATELGMI